MSVYSFSAKRMGGKDQSLSEYKGQILLIVNTASKCGFTPQYKELQALYEEFQPAGFNVLAFPCNQFGKQEPGTDEEIERFCEINYGVTFPLFEKVDVKGENAHPLFQYLTQSCPGILTSDIKWNFTKFLIDRQGKVAKRYAPTTSPNSIGEDIQRYLSKV